MREAPPASPRWAETLWEAGPGGAMRRWLGGAAYRVVAVRIFEYACG